MRKSLALLSILAMSILIVPAMAGNPQAIANKLLQSYETLKGYLLSVKDRDANLSAAVDEALAKADPLVDEAKSLIDSGDYKGAIEKLREALSILKEVLKEFKEPLKNDIRAMYSLRRMEYWLRRAQAVVARLSKFVNVTEVKQELSQVASLLEEAKSLISSGDTSGAMAKIDEARSALKQVYQDIREVVKESNLSKKIAAVRRVMKGANFCINRLDWLEHRLAEKNMTSDAERVRELKWNIMDQLEVLRNKIRSGSLTRSDVEAMVNLLKECKGILNEYRG